MSKPTCVMGIHLRPASFTVILSEAMAHSFMRHGEIWQGPVALRERVSLLSMLRVTDRTELMGSKYNIVSLCRTNIAWKSMICWGDGVAARTYHPQQERVSAHCAWRKERGWLVREPIACQSRAELFIFRRHRLVLQFWGKSLGNHRQHHLLPVLWRDGGFDVVKKGGVNNKQTAEKECPR